MKLEHLLKIYWAKGLFFNGHLNKINMKFSKLFSEINGFSKFSENLLINRLEKIVLKNNCKLKNKNLNLFPTRFKIFLNMYFSQCLPINNSIFDLFKINVIRLYLIKSFRGKAQALGKPSNGQRSWSNAWTAFKSNKLLRNFINEIVTINKLKAKPIKKNYRKIEKKLKKSKKANIISQIIIKKKSWF